MAVALVASMGATGGALDGGVHASGPWPFPVFPGWNADYLDGLDGGDLARATHDHDARYYPREASDDRYLGRADQAADSGLLDGRDSADFAAAGHVHDERYYTRAGSEGQFLGRSDKAADADRLDGLDSSAFLRTGGGEILGDLEIQGKLRPARMEPAYSGPATFTEGEVTFTVEDQAVWASNGHRYLYVRAEPGVTWLEARDVARTMNGYLATVTSGAEQAFLSDHLLGFGDILIGYTDARVEGRWEWVTGEIAPMAQDVVYANWRGGEPNDSAGEDAAAMMGPNGSHPGQWNDMSMTGKAPAFFVEISAFQSGG